MQVCQVEVTDEDLAWLRERAQGEPKPSRSKLARELCDRKQLLDGLGNRREVSVRVFLNRLEKRGQINLPPPAGIIQQPKPAGIVDLPEGTYASSSGDLKDLHAIEVVPVTARQKREHAQWVSLMESSHYLGRGPLCGAQIRFLVRCREGLLGALAFSACAWRLRARDKWIGWSEEARSKSLQLVVSNSRFLLVPKIPNLASHVLALSLDRLPSDFRVLPAGLHELPWAVG